MTNDEEDNAIEQDETENDEESQDQDMAEDEKENEDAADDKSSLDKSKDPLLIFNICKGSFRRCEYSFVHQYFILLLFVNLKDSFLFLFLYGWIEGAEKPILAIIDTM